MKPQINRYTVWVAPSGRVLTAEDIANGGDEVLEFKNQSQEDIFNLRMKYPSAEITQMQTTWGANKPARKDWKPDMVTPAKSAPRSKPAPSIGPKTSDYSDVVNTMMEKS